MDRASGVLLHITSLPSASGIGDLGPEAYNFADFLEETKQSYWQVLPLNETDPISGNSPYFSHSAFAANTLLISPEKLVDDGFLSAEDIAAPDLAPGTVDYNAVIGYKNGIFDKAYRRFKEGGGESGYDDFCAEHSGWLEDYALFMAIKADLGGGSWDTWPRSLRDREGRALKKAKNDLKEHIDREKFFQYVFFRQWSSLRSYCNERGVKIIGDIPIYVSYDSVDVWIDPHIFKLDEEKKPVAVSGVPPDYFSPTGQLWNNPVYKWDVLKKEGFSWWIKRLEHTFRYFDIVRVDHFRGLVKYWEIPAQEETAVNGEWKEVPVYDLFDALCGRFPDFPVIVEDLGVITDDVREVMDHYGFRGMKVLQFAFSEDNPEHIYLPHNYPTNCVAYPGTHDNNTLMGWIRQEGSPEEKERFFRYIGPTEPDGQVNWDVIRLLMESVADTVIIPMQDILGLDGSARMNQPRGGSENWRWRFLPGEITPSHAGRLRELTEIYGRAAKKELLPENKNIPKDKEDW